MLTLPDAHQFSGIPVHITARNPDGSVDPVNEVIGIRGLTGTQPDVIFQVSSLKNSLEISVMIFT